MWSDTHDSEPVWDDGSVGCARTPRMAIPGVGEQRGGRAAVRPTQWPLERGMALDVHFDAKAPTDTSMGYPAGLYRGVVDEAKAPTATGIQKLKVDFPGDLTMADVSLKRDQLYEPGQQPKDPTVADGEIAVRVRAEDLPQSKSVSRPYGLTEEQQRAILDVYERLDRAGVLHNDSNPLNLMARNGASEWRMVDFGFSKKVDKKRHKENPNLRMSLQTLLHSGTRGLVSSRKITTPPALLLAALAQNVHRPVMPSEKTGGGTARSALSPVNRA